MLIIKSIQNKIYNLRSKRVILDKDLAVLFQIQEAMLILAVQLHSKKFSEECMFQLTEIEFALLKFQIDTLEKPDNTLKFQTVSSETSYAFTTKGVQVLKNIFLDKLNRNQLQQIDDAIENLLDEKAAERKWNERERIGFRV